MSVQPLEFLTHLSACLISLSAQTPTLYWHLVQFQQVENSLFGEEQILIWQEGVLIPPASPPSLDTVYEPSPPVAPALFFILCHRKLGVCPVFYQSPTSGVLLQHREHNDEEKKWSELRLCTSCRFSAHASLL